MRTRSSFRGTLGALIAVIAASGASSGAASAQEGEAIAEQMAKLAPLVGSWKAEIKVYERGGTVTESVGAYEIAPVLEGTYLRWNATARKKGEESRPLFALMITYSVREKAYVQTYFYPQTALQVVEKGEYDEAKREYRTTTRIDFGSGPDYSVRSTTKFNADGTIDFWNWGRYENEEHEQLDMVARMTRAD